MKRKLFFVAFLATFLCFSCSDDNNNPDDGGGTDNPGGGGGTDNPGGGGTDNPGGGDGERTFTITEKDIETAAYERVVIAIKDSKTDTYTFESSDTLVAKVIDNGTIVPGQDGTATIKVTTSDKKFSETVSVKVDPYLDMEPICDPNTTAAQIRDYELDAGNKYINGDYDINGYFVYAFSRKTNNVMESRVQYTMKLSNENILESATHLVRMDGEENYERHFEAAKNYLAKRYEYTGYDMTGSREQFKLDNTGRLISLEILRGTDSDGKKRVQINFPTYVDMGGM